MVGFVVPLPVDGRQDVFVGMQEPERLFVEGMEIDHRDLFVDERMGIGIADAVQIHGRNLDFHLAPDRGREVRKRPVSPLQAARAYAVDSDERLYARYLFARHIPSVKATNQMVWLIP